MLFRPSVLLGVLALTATACNAAAPSRDRQLSPMSAERRDAIAQLRAIQSTASGEYALSGGHGAFVGADVTRAPLRFDLAGAHVEAPRAAFGVRLARLGRGEPQPVERVAPTANRNRVTFRHAAIEEWYENGPAGLEQGFELAERPAGNGPLALDLELDGVHAEAHGADVELRTADAVAANVRELIVADADGHEVPARFVVAAGALRIEVDDAGAHYPLSIDPLIGIATPLKPSDGSFQDANYGHAVRARGDRIIVSDWRAPVSGVTEAGAAYVYVRSGTTWVQEGKLVAPTPTAYGQFANAVDIDNDTAVAGSWQFNAQKGSVWVYKRTASTWSLYGTLTIAGALGGIGFGRTVALDGGRLLVGSQALNKKLYLFTSLVTGAAPAATITSTDTTLTNWGHSLAFQGGTIVVGAPDFSSTTSALEIYEGSGASYAFKQKIAYTGANFGTSVGVDGTGLIAYSHNTDASPLNVGMVYRRGTTNWALETTLSPGYAKNPNGVGAASISGNVAIVSGTDSASAAAASIYTRSTAGAWTRLSTVGGLGASAIVANAVSVDGDTAVIGAQQANTDAILRSGAATVYYPIVAWANGHACVDAQQCASGQCVDGYCCNTACTESCRACSVAGALGTCTAVPAGAPVGARMCSPSKSCAAGGTCSSACTTSGDCATGFFCNAGTCIAKKSNGAGCGGPTECTSGFCADGVCCNTACGGQCEACDVATKGGTCSPVLGAPRSTRPACAGATTGVDKDCAAACNGVDATKCYYPGATAACGKDACTASLETKVGKCDGAGKCGATSRACSPYACDATACKTTCLSKSDCAAGYSCKGGACVPSDGLGAACGAPGDCLDGLYCTDGVCCGVVDCGADKSCAAKPTAKGTCFAKQGAACALDAECASGFCVDGTCCDTRCDGQCEACDGSGDGTCGPVTGAPHGSRPACSAGADVCSAASCNGTVRASCAGFKAGPSVTCKPAECSGESLVPEATCDGRGACASPAPSSCGKYKCDPATTACRTACATADDCAVGFSCNGGVCSTGATCSADGASSIGPDGAKPCGLYRCGEDGNCRSACASSTDCANGALCDSTTKTCTAAPGAASGDSGGCAVPADRRTGGASVLLTCLVAALGLVSRRRGGAR